MEQNPGLVKIKCKPAYLNFIASKWIVPVHYSSFPLQILNYAATKEKYPMFSVVEGCAQEYDLEELCAHFAQQTVQVQRHSKWDRIKKPSAEEFVILWLLARQTHHLRLIYYLYRECRLEIDLHFLSPKKKSGTKQLSLLLWPVVPQKFLMGDTAKKLPWGP